MSNREALIDTEFVASLLKLNHMCTIAEKLNYFSYFLSLLREEFGMTKIPQLYAYKGFYLLGVQTVSNELDGQGGWTLFEHVFDDVRALPNGPVEMDIYQGRGIVPRWAYSQLERNFTPHVNQEAKVTIEHEKEVKTAFDSIKVLLENYQSDVDGIVELTHKLPLWQYAYYNVGEGTRMLTKNSDNRKYEYEVFQSLN